MEKLYFLCEFISTAIKIILSLKFVEVIAEPKWDEWLERAVKGVFVIALAAINTYNNSLGAGIFSNGFLLIIICFVSILARVLYRMTIGKIFALVFGVWTLITLLDFFCLSLLYVMLVQFHFSTDLFVEATMYRAVYLLVFAGGLIWCWHNIKNWILQYRIVIQGGIKKLKFWSLPLTFCLGLCIIYFQRVYVLLVTDRYMRSWIVFIISGVALLLMFMIYRVISKEKEKDALQNVKMHMLEQNYMELLKNQEEKSILLHDMKNHMVMLSDMIGNNEREKALEYIDQICNGLKKGNKQIWTNNAILDTILNAKVREAQMEGIEIQVECDELSEIILAPIDICALFANLLDNAIEANLKYNRKSNRWIRLSCKRQRYMLVISLSNPSDEVIDSRDGLPSTTKKKKEQHGFGLRSIKKVLDKYNGSLKFSTLDGEFRMILGLVAFESAKNQL